MEGYADGRLPDGTGLGGAEAPEPPSRLGPAGAIPSAGFERRVDFIPAFDKRHSVPSKNYGIGSMRIRLILIGEAGAVQWMIGTQWDVPSARKRHDWRDYGKPEGWDLGYHSPRPMYEGHDCRECDILPEGCYYDGSGLNADLLIEGFVAEGGDYIWRALEAYYRCTFEDAPWPFDEKGTIAASVDTLPKGQDGEAGLVRSKGSAVGEAETP